MDIIEIENIRKLKIIFFDYDGSIAEKKYQRVFIRSVL
jgi:hypothetical protein